VTARLARQLEGRCCYGACAADALDGSDYCGPHDAREKGRDRSRKRRQRQRLADAGVCIVAGCGRRVGKRMTNGRAIQRRCAGCAKALRQAARDRRSVPNSRAVQPRVKLEVGRDGATRTRYTGQGRRGGPSREETERGHLRLMADAKRLDAAFEAVYPAELAAIDAMPRIQRAEARSLIAWSLVRSARLRLQVAEEIDASLREICGACGRPHDPEDDEDDD